MPLDDRSTLEVLIAELNFLQKWGYGGSRRDPGNATLIFEDSPTCMNHGHKDHPRPCSECLLIQFVPPEKRSEKVPCRYLPLTPDGDTLMHFYRGATEQELEEAVEAWLKRQIANLETQKATPPPL
jgi:hypothetical protein